MSKTALILLDLQQGIFDRIKDDTTEYFSRVLAASKAARAAGISVIYVKTCFRPGHPEVSSRNLTFEKVSAAFGGAIEGDPTTAICPSVAPLESDILVTKRRVSAFSGSDLDVVLRGLNVESLVLGGVSTSGAVLSTLRQAADLDFKLTVLGDLCLDLDAEVHRVLVEKIFTRQGRTLTTEQWIQELGSSKE